MLLQEMYIKYFGNENANKVFIQLSDERELPIIEESLSKCESTDYLLAVVIVDDWNKDLSPWKAPGVFGEDFGDGADKTLDWVLNNLIDKDTNKNYYLIGYSLAGLFALYSAYKTDVFSGIAAVSPSVWFPGFVPFCKEGNILTKNVYLSLGDKEHKTRNAEMAKVKDSIEEIYKDLKKKEINCVLEYNPGNHFKDVGERMTKGLVWLLSNA